MSTRATGRARDARDPDRVLGSPSRWLMFALAILLAALGMFFLAAGAIASPVPGAGRDPLPIAFGAVLFLVGVAAR